MKQERKKRILAAAALLAAFALWTAAVRLIDVQAIGPQGSSVGMAAINGWIHRRTGVNMTLYAVTDGLSLVPAALALGFALLGLSQWVKRKRIRKVDRSILALGGFYCAVMAAYIFFEVNEVNYRPVLIDGVLEPSYPSSTVLLVLCIMPTSMMQFAARLKNRGLRRFAVLAMSAFTVLMLLGRFVSGVHWFSDIIGGVLLSAGLVMAYAAACGDE